MVAMIRALGKQGIASIATVVGYWIIGIPLSILCVFGWDLGIQGLWYGPSAAVTFNYFLYFFIVMKSNWNEIAI